jgi:hypothetical protein
MPSARIALSIAADRLQDKQSITDLSKILGWTPMMQKVWPIPGAPGQARS